MTKSFLYCLHLRDIINFLVDADHYLFAKNITEVIILSRNQVHISTLGFFIYRWFALVFYYK